MAFHYLHDFVDNPFSCGILGMGDAVQTHKTTKYNMRPNQPTNTGPGLVTVFVIGGIGFLLVAVIVGYVMVGGSHSADVGSNPLPPPPVVQPRNVIAPVKQQTATSNVGAQHLQPQTSSRTQTASANDVITMVAKDTYDRAKLLFDAAGDYPTPELSNLLNRLVTTYSDTPYGPKAKELLAKLRPFAYPSNYWVVKGFPNPNDWSGLNTVYGPEQYPFDQSQVFTQDGQRLSWVKTGLSGEAFVDLLPGEWQTAYAYCTITSPVDQKVMFFMGTDDTAKMWLNGEVVYNNTRPRGVIRDEDKVPARLKEGVNTVLIKVCQGNGDWGFTMDIGLDKPVTFAP